MKGYAGGFDSKYIFFLNIKIHQWHKALWEELALWVMPTSKI